MVFWTLWWFLKVFDGSCWLMVVLFRCFFFLFFSWTILGGYFGSLWFFVILDGSVGFLVVLGGSWWFLVAFGSSW